MDTRIQGLGAMVATVIVWTDGAPSLSSDMSKLKQEDKWLKLLIESITLPDDNRRSSYLNEIAMLWWTCSTSWIRNLTDTIVPKFLHHHIMDEIHVRRFGEHFAPKGLYEILCQQYYWDDMYADAQAYCKGCLTYAAY